MLYRKYLTLNFIFNYSLIDYSCLTMYENFDVSNQKSKIY